MKQTKNAFSNVQADPGLAEADTTTDTLTIAGGTNITTSVAGDTVTINGTVPTLASLSDTDTSGTITGNVLVYNGSNWVTVQELLMKWHILRLQLLLLQQIPSNGYKFDPWCN